MNYEEAIRKSLKVEWKVGFCPQGDKCWCRTIEPIEPITFINQNNEEDEFYILPIGSLNKETVEHLVKLHNNKLNLKSQEDNTGK